MAEGKIAGVLGLGYFAAVRVNQHVRMGILARGFDAFSPLPFRLSGECRFYDCTGPYCAEPALYVRRAGAAAVDHRAARRATHADRHFSGHSDPRDRPGLAVHRPATDPDVRPNPTPAPPP